MDTFEPTFYKHRQFGWPLIGFTAVFIAGLEVFLSRLPGIERNRILQWLPLLLACVLVLLFFCLEISVTRSHLKWRFGLGLISASESLSNIVSVETTRTSVLTGWGIRFTPRGTLYNVAGFDALLVTTRDGKTFLLGTDDAYQLQSTLQLALHDRERQRVG